LKVELLIVGECAGLESVLEKDVIEPFFIDPGETSGEHYSIDGEVFEGVENLVNSRRCWDTCSSWIARIQGVCAGSGELGSFGELGELGEGAFHVGFGSVVGLGNGLILYPFIR
jgi:hypothetical protein